MKFEFPGLPYAYDALEPHIDKMTMEIHYSKHHRTYYDKFAAAIQGTPLENQTFEEIFAPFVNLFRYSRENLAVLKSE